MCGVNCICSNVGVAGCDVVMDGCVVLDDLLWSWHIQVWSKVKHNIQIELSIFVYIILYCIILYYKHYDIMWQEVQWHDRVTQQLSILILYTFWTHIYTHTLHTDKTRAHTHVLEFQVLTDIYNTHKHGIALMPKWHSDQHSEAEW